MTLVELLVAMALFAMLGGTLVLMLNQGVGAWRTGESRRALYEEAQAVLERIRDDLRAAAAQAPPIRGRAPVARFTCDADLEGRPRLAFVRSIPFESRHPIASLAGTLVGADRDLDGEADRDEAFDGRLRATRGLEEVLYAMEPGGDALLRVARAPPGGPASLFDLRVRDDPKVLGRLGRSLAAKVLHFEVALWTQHTEAWDGDPPLRLRIPGRTNGPVFEWDSTRGELPPPEGAQPDEFHFWKGEASRDDPSDDVFPERALVTIVLADEGPAAAWTKLAAPMSADARTAEVLDTVRFKDRGAYARIGREWVRFRIGGPTTLKIDDRGRGARWTRPTEHKAGEDVVTGRAFSIEVDLPAWREDWSEAAGGRRP